MSADIIILSSAAAAAAGALVAGPDASDGFTDVRTNTAQLAVGLNGNVFLSGLLAGLLDRHVKAGECHGGRGEALFGYLGCYF
jgi:hypothetical protein